MAQILRRGTAMAKLVRPPTRRYLNHVDATPNSSRHPLAPLLHTVRHYSGKKFRSDLIAGLTVSVVEIPQAMAYAMIAGVDPVYGIYTSVLQGVLGALLSSSEHLTTGPTNTQSLLIAATVQRLVGDPANPMYLELVFALAILKGLIQLAFAAARMGTLIRYVSKSVILGVSAGAGVLIAVGQLPNILGVSLAGMDSPLPGIVGTLHRLTQCDGVSARAILICAGCVAIVVGCRLLWRFVPGSLIAVAAAAGVTWSMGWTHDTLPQVGPLPQGLPTFRIPRVTLPQVEDLFAGALALALIGMIESVAIVKSIASRSGERIDPNQEFLAQGLKNFLTGFFQCIPGSGSFTRSALDYEAGGATRFAAVFNGFFVACIFFLLAPAAAHIPLASLAAVLLVIAYGLIDWRYFLRLLRTSRAEVTVYLMTFLAVILIPLEYAVFVGIFLNLALYLRQASQLHIAEMVAAPAPGGAGGFIERPITNRQGQQRVVFLQVEGDLFFGIADELHDRLHEAAGPGVRVVILRLKRTHSLDATVLGVLEQFTRDMQGRGGHLVLCGLRPDLLETIRQYGLVELIGERNIFETGLGVFTSAKRAIARARQLVGESIDSDSVTEQHEEEGGDLTYQI